VRYAIDDVHAKSTRSQVESVRAFQELASYCVLRAAC
jgi:hypothetical protein